MSTARLHIEYLRTKYPECADRLVRELGKERQGPTWVFEDYGGAEFRKVVELCLAAGDSRDDSNSKHATLDVEVAMPREKRGLVAKSLARLARPEDKGLGDVVQRVAEKLGGEKFKNLYKSLTGVECGCTDRQKRLNEKFPLSR